MNSSIPTLQLDTSALYPPEADRSEDKSPTSTIRSRAKLGRPVLSVSSAISPNAEKAPLSPLFFKDTSAGKGKAEMVKALSFQLEKVSQRPRAPSIIEAKAEESARSTRRPTLPAIGKTLSNDLNGLVNQEDDDDEEDVSIFSPDNAAELTNNLLNLLFLSLDRGFNLFEEESTSWGESQRDASKIKTSSSPFRRRRRSQSAIRSRSASPVAPKHGHQVSGLLERGLHLLQSLISEDCRFPISRPRPGLPPNALQSFCLDVAQILAHLYEHSPAIMSQIAFAVLPAFSTFHLHMIPRLLKFFEECILRRMLSSASTFSDIQQPASSKEALSFNTDDAAPPLVAIQVEAAADDNSSSTHGWRRWLSLSDMDRRLTSSNSPAQPLDLYELMSIVPPFLSAALERLDVEETPYEITFRFYRILDMLIQFKPDIYLDLLQTVAYHVQVSRRRSFSVLSSYWPRALGHFTVSKPFSVICSPPAMVAAAGSSSSTANRMYAHQFVPWRFIHRPRPILFDGSSFNDCRVCLKPIDGFGLFCPFCMCATHYDCYDYPDGNLVTPYNLDADGYKQKLAVYRFCHILPTRHTVLDKPLVKFKHAFRPVNIFALSLCFICHLPLWGCWEQALKCDVCHFFAHRTCVVSPGANVDMCGSTPLLSKHLSIAWDDFESSFSRHYSDLPIHDSKDGFRYEELAILRDVLNIQKSILSNGLALGSIVIEGFDTLPVFKLDAVIESLEGALTLSTVQISASLDEFLQENQLHYSQHSVLYDWPTLMFIASSIRTPSADTTEASSPSFLAAHPVLAATTDAVSNPYEVLTLAHLRDTLGISFQLHSELSARLLLSHLRHTGFYDRIDAAGIPHEPFSAPETTLCVFPLPFGLDMSVDVEILVAAIESSLSDIDLSVNEAGFLLLTRRFWPNQMATAYALQRLAKAVLSWVMNEDHQIAIILRDYLPARRPLPGVRAGQDKQPWPYDATTRAIHATSVNNGGDYVAHRRTLLRKYASVWLLALHDQDIPFYALILYETLTELTDEASISEHVDEENLPVFLADTSLRSIVRLSQASVVFTIFDDLLLRWLESASGAWRVRQAVPTVTRLLGRDTAATTRISTARGANLTQTESSLGAGMDPWSIIMRAALSGQAAFQQALQWLAIMATSGVDIPAAIFQQFADLSGRFSLSIASTMPLISALFSSSWLRSLGRQELLGVVASLHIRLSSALVIDLRQEGTVLVTAISFVRLSLSVCLLAAGCEREKLLKNEFVLDDDLCDLPSRRSVNTRGGNLATDPISLSARFVAALGDYVGVGEEQAGALVGWFLYMFMKDCQMLESYEVDNFVLRNAGVLTASAWQFYDIQVASLSSVRPYILLHLLSVEPQPFQTLLNSELSVSRSWYQRLKCLKQVFRILLDVTSPDFTVDEKQWRTGVVFIFDHFFRTMWQDPQEEIRVSIGTWAQTLLPSHREQIALCWNEALSKAPIADRTTIISTLIHLQPHFPSWQVATWKTLTEVLMEEGHLQASKGDAPAAAHLSMYGLVPLKASPSNLHSPDVDAMAFHFSTVLLCLKMIAAGIPTDTYSYLTVKFYLLRALGFNTVVSQPSAAGQSFYIAFDNLGATSDLAWPCIEELPALFDSPATTLVSEAMVGPSQGEDEAKHVLVGTAFVDVLIAFVNDFGELTTLPYESAKALLQSMIIVVHKHDFDSKILARLYAPLRRAIRRALSFTQSDAPYDLRQLGISVAHAFIKTRPGLAGAFVPDSVEIISKVVINLELNREDILVQHAFSYLELTFATYADSAVLLALFKKLQDRSVHRVLKSATLNMLTYDSSGNQQLLRDVLLKDTLTRISDPSLDAEILQAALSNLHIYLDMTHSQPIPIDLMHHIGTTFNTIIRRAADWPADTFDPGVLLSIVSTAIQYNKASSRELLLATETLLRAALARFQISSTSLIHILESDDRAMNPVSHAFLEIYSEALRGGTHVLSATLKAMTDAVFEKFIEGDSKSGADAIMWANKLPLDGLTYLTSHGGSQAYDEMDLDASLSVARLVLDGVEHSADFFHQALRDQANGGKANRQLSLRSWNVLALASLHRESSKTAHALMEHFSSFAATFHDSLITPWGLAPTDKASTINHCYTSIKLWLLLAKRLSDDGSGRRVDASNSTTFMVWNDLWPPFLHLLTELTTGAHSRTNVAMATVATTSVADLLLFLRDFHSVVFLEITQQVANLRKLQAASQLELSNTKLDRTLREIVTPVPPVPWDTLLAQARIDVIAAEKLEKLESLGARPREPKPGFVEHRGSLATNH